MCDATFLNVPNPKERPAHTCKLQDEWCLMHAAKWRYVSQTFFCYFVSKFHTAE